MTHSPDPQPYTPTAPRGVVALDAGLVLAEAQVSYDGPDPTDGGMHLWTAVFPQWVADELLLSRARLHIGVLPARTSVQIDLGDDQPGGTDPDDLDDESDDDVETEVSA